MIQLSASAEGIILPVRAQPGARRNAIVGEQNGVLKVAVTAPPDKGKANDAIQAVLCESFGLKRSQVELVAGPASRDKKFLIRGRTADSLTQLVRSVVKS